MKKHIFGLALFSFIVSTTAIVYASFDALFPTPQVNVVSTPRYIPIPRNSCKMKFQSKSVKVNQAVLDLQTKQFNWELATPDIDEPIALHFFSKDNKGTRYIASERVINTFSHNGILRFSNSYLWLNQRNSYNNLYVIAEFAPDSSVYNESHSPEFDAGKATAVTIDYGE